MYIMCICKPLDLTLTFKHMGVLAFFGPHTVMELRHAGISSTLENKHQSPQNLKLMYFAQTVMEHFPRHLRCRSIYVAILQE